MFPNSRVNLDTGRKGQMGNKRCNPKWFQWYKGMPCLNPSGRPKGSYTFYPPLRWHRFVWGLMEPPYTGAAAARKAGYSRKSARFIASRLRRKPAVRELIREFLRKVEGTRNLGRGLFMIPDDKGGYYFYQKPDWKPRDVG